MRSCLRTWSVAVAGALLIAVGAQPALALIDVEQKCLEKIGKAGGKFVKKKLKAVQKCNNKNLKEPGDCPQPELDATITTLVTNLGTDIDKKCLTVNSTNITNMGFPGKCVDANQGDGFTLADIKDCIHDSHETIVDDLIDIEYGGTTSYPDQLTQKCQEAIAKNGEKFVSSKLKAVQKCRNDINKGKLTGIAPRTCSTGSTKAQASIAKAESKARAGINDKCDDAQALALDACDPPADTEPDLENCIIDTHGDLTDNDIVASRADLIDFEYASPLSCGDEVLNSAVNPFDFSEECDGATAGSCPGQCGVGTGPFPCLCTDIPRERVIEHANADLDNGWTGLSHDSGIVEGGGYVADLFDCDGPAGPDTLCTVGPSCTVPVLGVNAPCSTNADCGANGPCRKTVTAVGPHCNLDLWQTCSANTDCLGAGNYCVKAFHGPPLPLAAGGVAVCVLNVFSEDVVGTKNLVSGSSAVRLRQFSITHGPGPIDRPCPICGGWCNDPVVGGVRNRCESDDDCKAAPNVRAADTNCVLQPLCNIGPNRNLECRPDFPFGGATQLFGTTSVDCPPEPSSNISANGIDILFNPVTTGTVTKFPSIQCDEIGYQGKTCLGGPNEGRPCTDDSECTPGTCTYQCFCPTGGPAHRKQKPNDCEPACVGGANEAQPCGSDFDCDPPNGFCHPADCRENPSDATNPHDGACTVGPLAGTCSAHPNKTCNTDNDCEILPSECTGVGDPAVCCTGAGTGCSGLCTFCDPNETCDIAARQCFVGSGYTRVGLEDPDDPTGVAAFCETSTGSSSINSTAGLPGPAAIVQPSSRELTGF